MITREDIENIAILSKLFVPEDELDILTCDMQKIIDFADTINNAQQSTETFDNINNLSNAFRSDEVKDSYAQSEILRNAPESKDQHFLLRKKA